MVLLINHTHTHTSVRELMMSSCAPTEAQTAQKIEKKSLSFWRNMVSRPELEVEVKAGAFSKHMMDNWKSCKKLHLVDLWARQENYRDIANVSNRRHEI